MTSVFLQANSVFTVLSQMLFGAPLRDVMYFSAVAVLVALVLFGISRMSKVETAVSGNKIGSVAMLLAIILTLWYFQIFTFIELWISLAIGSVLGLWLANKVKMIQMPEMVGLLNGFGGLASLIAAVLVLQQQNLQQSNGWEELFAIGTSGLAIFVGGATWLGSVIAAAKLHKLISQKPRVFKHHQALMMLSALISLATIVFMMIPALNSPLGKTLNIIVAVISAQIFGYLFAIRVGGADMPITISLLNSFSGIAGSIAGMAIMDPLLVVVGGIVGASGIILTQIMCKAMNRKLLDILMGKTTTASIPKVNESSHGQKQLAHAAETKETPVVEATTELEQALNLTDLAAAQLIAAENILVVPGYGMALSQAQNALKSLINYLEEKGKQVSFAIHPVAGRMPGHMNVLLAEVDIPYDKLLEMDEANPLFKDADVTLVVGANDVINPAAKDAVGTPIYGMPILEVEEAKFIIICNLDEAPGYAGVENPLYNEAKESADRVIMLKGDAKNNLEQLRQTVSQDNANLVSSDIAEQAEEDSSKRAAHWLSEAKQAIIVPGYGLAVAQAQSQLKDLVDRLEGKGIEIDYAIHPVAGRMPGHMNVLLAEVDVPYEKLKEMDEINPKFVETDVVLAVGANDVLNPAANTEVGTPIYGMPVLDVAHAKRIIICNYDLNPGYSGVENPLYKAADAEGKEVIVLTGDAKDSLRDLMAAL